MLVVGHDDYVVNDPGLFYKLPGMIILCGADLEHFFKLGSLSAPESPDGSKKKGPRAPSKEVRPHGAAA